MIPIRLSAPGRICLFGEHQSYLGLPVVAAAIDLRVRISAAMRPEPGFSIEMPDIAARLDLDPRKEQQLQGSFDILRSGINVLRREGLTWVRGFNLAVRGDLPISAGVGSSSALVTAWIRFLLETADLKPAFLPRELARWAYQAEVTELGGRHPMVDHYCCALGGILSIETREPFSTERYAVFVPGIVLANSLETAASPETLSRMRENVTNAITLLKEHVPSFDVRRTGIKEVEPMLDRLPRGLARALNASLRSRDLTLRAPGVIRTGNSAELGGLLTEHHRHLRDDLHLSSPKIERMLDACMAAGALGGKVNGCGGGGCMFVLAPGKEAAMASAIRSEGGIPHVVRVGDGAHVDPVDIGLSQA